MLLKLRIKCPKANISLASWCNYIWRILWNFSYFRVQSYIVNFIVLIANWQCCKLFAKIIKLLLLHTLLWFTFFGLIINIPNYSWTAQPNRDKIFFWAGKSTLRYGTCISIKWRNSRISSVAINSEISNLLYSNWWMLRIKIFLILNSSWCFIYRRI